MRVNKAQLIGVKTLVGFIQQKDITYGPKFQRLSEVASQKFDRIIRIDISSQTRKKYENHLLPMMIFASILLKKTQRIWEEPGFKADDFIRCLHYKKQEIMSRNSSFFHPEANSRFEQFVNLTMNDPATICNIDRHAPYIYELINAVAQKKVKDFEMVDNYTYEEIGLISSFFRQKLCFMNYDQDKECMEPNNTEPKNIYLLKAKDQYFLLIKFPSIALTRQEKVSHEEFAEIFKIQDKLEDTAHSRVQGTNQLIKNHKGNNRSEKASTIRTDKGSTIKKDNPDDYPSIDLVTKKSHESSSPVIHSPGTTPTLAKLKNSSLFPDEVKCKLCCKEISQFNALYWNYCCYCLQCVVSPKVDISFVPTSTILKYLKSVGYQNNSPYHVVCPQCHSQGIINHYRVQDKPKEYRCKACQKIICIQHQQLIVECFCYCIQCNKHTFTIEQYFQKYCATCKTRACQLCNKRGKGQCDCMCKKCGLPNLPDHECLGQCHSCKGTKLALIDCNCNRQLCSTCYFRNMEPGEQICKS